MTSFNNETAFVIARNLGVGRICRVNPTGSHTPLEYPAEMKLGEAAKLVARANPEKRIGILANSLGPHCQHDYGEIVWLKPEFGR